MGALLRRGTCLFAFILGISTAAGNASAAVQGWLNWRGPQHDGTSLDTGLPDRWTPGGTNDRWSYDLAGGGTPIIANGRVYAFGYQGEGPDLQEVLVCL